MPPGTPKARKSIFGVVAALAVVGAGVAGLTAAYIPQRQADVTLYEADDRLGGHAHAHDVLSGQGRMLAVDTGFIVFHRAQPAHLPRCCGCSRSRAWRPGRPR